MKRVLITGANGFIGRHTLPLLKAHGFEVHATVSNPQTQNLSSDYNWHVIDLLQPSEIPLLLQKVQPSHLLHLAWYTEHGQFWHSLQNFNWVQSSLALLQAFYAGGGERVLMAGTGFEYDMRYGYCSEFLTPKLPATVYGASKNALQNMLAAFSQQTGLSSAWGHVFLIFGPYEYEKRLVASVIRSLLREEPALCSHGQQIRDFLYVKEVASACVALLESQVQGPVNIASGSPLTLKDLIYQIADQLNHRDLIQLGAIPAPLHEPPLQVANIQRLVEEVGWKPAYSLATALAETIQWWKSGNHE